MGFLDVLLKIAGSFVSEAKSYNSSYYSKAEKIAKQQGRQDVLDSIAEKKQQQQEVQDWIENKKAERKDS